MYASLLGMSGALHLGIFDQPAEQVFFSNLLAGCRLPMKLKYRRELEKRKE